MTSRCSEHSAGTNERIVFIESGLTPATPHDLAGHRPLRRVPPTHAPRDSQRVGHPAHRGNRTPSPRQHAYSKPGAVPVYTGLCGLATHVRSARGIMVRGLGGAAAHARRFRPLPCFVGSSAPLPAVRCGGPARVKTRPKSVIAARAHCACVAHLEPPRPRPLPGRSSFLAPFAARPRPLPDVASTCIGTSSFALVRPCAGAASCGVAGAAGGGSGEAAGGGCELAPALVARVPDGAGLSCSLSLS